MNPTTREIDNTLRQLEQTKMEIADEWQSDAERLRLPRTNLHDDKGAPVLDRDAVLRRSLPDCIGLG